ncbi:MAG TPA: acyl-CoA dehydrogenase, partial [Steroidobacteraceae bacterium]|nr:acyl-CoA dehydrogenase [Steroidobacteraceae bacterium]
MPEYVAPLADMRFVLNELVGLGALAARLPAFESASPDVVDSILEEAGRFAHDVLSPLNRSGDKEGSRLEDGQVHAAKGFGEAYRQLGEAGWVGLTGNPDSGGQGLPHVVGAPASEMWAASNAAFSNASELCTGVIEALESHAAPELRARFLPRILSGEWTGTMCLTEPQAGSDLAAVATRAEPFGDRYRLYGRKIFITWGDHDMTPNIIHMVLARAPDAPAGVKGISLFLVPKFLVNADGSLGARNDVTTVSIEHKLGLHASPTCVLAFGDDGGAEGYLVGNAHQGLPYMFTMMNYMRLGVGLQGIGLAERAYQQAVAYARERVQGRSIDGRTRVSIIKHADVRRMLMNMRAQIEAARAMAYMTAAHLDLAHHDPDTAQRRRHLARVELLTPLVKAWGTEIAQECAATGVQVHGGMGFIEETGAAQHIRDARITTIYEGTNGIQAMDLVGRKILRDGGEALQDLLSDLRATAAATVDAQGNALSRVADALEEAARMLLKQSDQDPQLPGAVAFDFLMALSIGVGAWHMARASAAAQARLASKSGDGNFHRAKIVTARHYFDRILPRAHAHLEAVRSGSASITELAEEAF